MPTRYVHVVFTLPRQLSPLALQNKREVYALLFRASAETLLQVARDPQRLGAEIGFFSVLHTWNQKLQHHPHVHCVVPAGGLAPDHYRWIDSQFQELDPLRFEFGQYLGRLPGSAPFAQAIGAFHFLLEEIMGASKHGISRAEAHELVEQSLFYGLLAESYLSLGLPQRAMENVDRGLDLVSELGERFFEAPLLRLKARCLSGTGDAAAAPEIAALFDRAQQLAIQQGAVAWRSAPN